MDPLEELERVTYVTEQTIELDRCADEGPWDPSGLVLELVPNAKQIAVTHIDQSTSLNVINTNLRSHRIIGLVVMGKEVNRKSLPGAIVMTTPDTLYVIDPKDVDRGVRFLKAKLEDPSLEFFTTNGIDEADCLLHNYGICLEKAGAKVNCCTGLNIFLMDLLKSLPTPALAGYPICAVNRSKREIMVESYEKLVELWLDIYPEEYSYEPDQLAHLYITPPTETAINVIKKRCIFVIQLAGVLQSYVWLETKIISQSTCDTLKGCDKKTRRLVIQGLKMSKDDRVVDCSRYAHLNVGMYCYRY